MKTAKKSKYPKLSPEDQRWVDNSLVVKQIGDRFGFKLYAFNPDWRVVWAANASHMGPADVLTGGGAMSDVPDWFMAKTALLMGLKWNYGPSRMPAYYQQVMPAGEKFVAPLLYRYEQGNTLDAAQQILDRTENKTQATAFAKAAVKALKGVPARESFWLSVGAIVKKAKQFYGRWSVVHLWCESQPMGTKS